MSSPRRALVTGASAGLGADLVRRFAESGWEVIGCGRRLLDDAAAPAVRYIQLDLTEPGALQDLVRECDGTLDLVVHNAVRYPKREQGVNLLDELELTFHLNTFVPYLLTTELLAAKSPERFCSFVVVNSDSMFHADEHSGIYASSKAALRVLTGSLASSCRSRNASISTLLLGPLADPKKLHDLERVATDRGVTVEEMTRRYLKMSNPDLVIDHLVGLDACFDSVRYLEGLGSTANGMVCRLDGGSAGSLI